MSVWKHNKVLEELIELYKSQPCLWRVKCKEYHDRTRRDAAYTKLLTMLRECEPDTVKDTVVKKIHNLRCNYRKEKKKVDVSKKSGAGTDELYKPTLWYYDLFDFLSDQETPGTSQSNLDDDERSRSDDDTNHESQEPLPHSENVHEVEEEASTSLMPTTSENKRGHPLSRPNMNKKMKPDSLANDVLLSVREHFKKPPPVEDRYDLVGRTIAMRLRGLDHRQGLIAEKRISDLLFEAELAMMPTSMRRNFGRVDHSGSMYIHSSGSPSPTNTDSPYSTSSPLLQKPQQGYLGSLDEQLLQTGSLYNLD